MPFSQEEQKHIDFMKEILYEIKSRNLDTYLKGGTALLLCYDLDRFSEDIDLDANKKFNLESIINAAAKRVGIVIEDIKIPKDTDTVRRYKVKYVGRDAALKIETSLRDEINPDDLVEKNGINTYKVEKIIEMKIAAIKGRTKARDFHDITYLLETHPESFSKEQVEDLDTYFSDDNSFSFLESYVEDTILAEEHYFTDYENFTIKVQSLMESY